MARPDHFAVTYAINPWMSPTVPVDQALAVRQWESLRSTYLDLGHQVSVIDTVTGLPDMVYAANGALVTEQASVAVRFAHAERAAEAPLYAAWLEGHGFGPVHEPTEVNEGEGDLLVVGPRILAGTGFRTSRAAHAEVAELTGMPVVSLELVDPHYYHLDTALTVLDAETVAYLPEAFSPTSQAVLADLYPDAILATAADAAVLGLNAVSDGKHVILPVAATGLATQYTARGYQPIGLDLSELLKGGGGIKCCTLILRGGSPA